MCNMYMYTQLTKSILAGASLSSSYILQNTGIMAGVNLKCSDNASTCSD